MYRNLIILAQSIVIGILALTLVFTMLVYHRVKEDRDNWANFMISAYTECEYECNQCLSRFAHDYKNKNTFLQ